MNTTKKCQTSLHDTLADGSKGPAMVWLRGGRFTMGQVGGDYYEEQAHVVEVSAFSIGQYPLTFEEYDYFCEAAGRDKPDDRGWGRGRHPVINITWDEATAYCDWLNSQQQNGTYRLPTEAEWEYACRAGSGTRWNFGDDQAKLGNYAWFDGNSEGRTHPVGEKTQNAWQLHDMHGNVWEWCADWFADGTYERRAAATGGSTAASRGGAAAAYMIDPVGPAEGSHRVFRGGAWSSVAGYCRSAYRSGHVPSFRNSGLGFRLARTGPWPAHSPTVSHDDAKISALHIQHGGSHYKDLRIQPVEYNHANNLGYCEGSVVKYVSRWRSKGGIDDLKKARHFLDLLIELEANNEP